MQAPHIVLNWFAIIAAIVAAFIFGFLWYGPFMGKTWAKLMGFSPEQCKPDPAKMIKMLALQLIGTFLTTYVLAHSTQVWRPTVWGVGADAPNWMYGSMSAVFTWIGFYVPLQMNKCTWEGKPWKLFALNSAHDIINLMIIAQILANWR
jgi:hypothetical protein